MFAFLFNRVSAMIASSFGRAAPAAQAASAQAIAKLSGQSVPGTARGVVDAIKLYAGNNPTKLAIAANAVATAGVSLSMDKVMDVFRDEGVTGEVIDIIGAEVSEVLRQQRARVTGDGNINTQHGSAPEDRLKFIREQRVISSKIETAARALGVSVPTLVAIREVIFLEDADFMLYQEGSN